MNPFYFGPAHRRLFGILSGATASGSATGVVLCPPLGREAIVTHRTYRILADQLASRGAPVLRFDYFGTGDSHGSLGQGPPAEWLEDVRCAVEELRQRTAARRVHLVGLRLGAYLALAAEVRAVAGLVLWDPVIQVQTHVDELLATAATSGVRGWDVDGFWYPTTFIEEMRQVSLLEVRRVPREVKILLSADSPDLPVLQAFLTGRKARVDVARFDSAPAWVEETDLGAGAVPTEILSAIVRWLT